jgi:hypothetical protein
MRQLNNWKLRPLPCRINNTIITPFLPFYGKNMAKYYFGNKKAVVRYSNYLIAEVITQCRQARLTQAQPPNSAPQARLTSARQIPVCRYPTMIREDKKSPAGGRRKAIPRPVLR